MQQARLKAVQTSFEGFLCCSRGFHCLFGAASRGGFVILEVKAWGSFPRAVQPRGQELGPQTQLPLWSSCRLRSPWRGFWWPCFPGESSLKAGFARALPVCTGYFGVGFKCSQVTASHPWCAVWGLGGGRGFLAAPASPDPQPAAAPRPSCCGDLAGIYCGSCSARRRKWR